MKKLIGDLFLFLTIAVLAFLLFLTDCYLRSFTRPLMKRETEKVIGEVEKGWDIAFIKELKKKAHEKSVKKKEEKKTAIPEATSLLSCIRADKAPIIDGKLDDSCWKHAQKAANFIYWKGWKLAEEETIAQVVYDRRNIYFSFLCWESEIERIQAGKRKRDSNVFADDCIEVFIDTNHDGKTYYHFAVNSIGTQYDARHDDKKTGKSWNGDWMAAVSSGRNFWTVEAAIPLKTVGVRRVREGDVWGLNLNRERHIEANDHSSWSCTFGGFHNPEHFGDLVFRKEALPYLEIVSFGAIDLKEKSVLKVKLINPEEKKRSTLTELEAISPKGKKWESTFREVDLQEKEEEIEFEYEIKEIGMHSMVVSLLSKKSAEIYYRTANLPVGLTDEDFIREWFLCGPFPNPGGRIRGQTQVSPNCQGWGVDFLKGNGGEKGIEPRSGMSHRIDISPFKAVKPKWEGDWPSSKVKWTTHKQKNALIDFTKLFKPKEYVLGYAACYLESDKEKQAIIKLGSDDGYKLWFNHELIASEHIHRGSKPDQNSHRIHLKKGRNLLLLKVDQDYGGFNFYLRLTDLEGKPLILP